MACQRCEIFITIDCANLWASQWVSKAMGRGGTEGTTEGMSEGMNEGTTEGTTDETSEGKDRRAHTYVQLSSARLCMIVQRMRTA